MLENQRVQKDVMNFHLDTVTDSPIPPRYEREISSLEQAITSTAARDGRKTCLIDTVSAAVGGTSFSSPETKQCAKKRQQWTSSHCQPWTCHNVSDPNCRRQSTTAFKRAKTRRKRAVTPSSRVRFARPSIVWLTGPLGVLDSHPHVVVLSDAPIRQQQQHEGGVEVRYGFCLAGPFSVISKSQEFVHFNFRVWQLRTAHFSRHSLPITTAALGFSRQDRNIFGGW